MSDTAPRVVVVAGPNGAGKTTFARAYIADQPWRYLSADDIATRMVPHAPAEAAMASSREFLRTLDEVTSRGESILIESTLSGKTLANRLRTARRSGYAIDILFLYLENVATAVERVRSRVRLGGHDVPEADIRRRFTRSMENFATLYVPLADSWSIFSNSGAEPRCVAEYIDRMLRVFDAVEFQEKWRSLEGDGYG